MPSIDMVLSTALHISNSVKAATLAAVNASISTPVCPANRQNVSMRTLFSSGNGSNCTDTLLSMRGWQSGIS